MNNTKIIIYGQIYIINEPTHVKVRENLELLNINMEVMLATPYVHTVVPAFNGPSDERTPAMAGHFLNIRTVLPC